MTCSDCYAEIINRIIALEHTLQQAVDRECALHNELASLLIEFGRIKQFYHEKGVYKESHSGWVCPMCLKQNDVRTEQCHCGFHLNYGDRRK